MPLLRFFHSPSSISKQLRHKNLHHLRWYSFFLLDNLITDFPKRRRPRRPVRIVVLIEPVPQNPPGAPDPADLHALAAPALLEETCQWGG